MRECRPASWTGHVTRINDDDPNQKGVDDERILSEVPGAPGDTECRGGNVEERAGGYSWQVWQVRNDDVQDGRNDS